MSSEHKAALAGGRSEGLAARRYLEALERHKPRRGRRPSTEGLQKQLDDISKKLGSAEPLARLHLLQQRRDVEDRLEAPSDTMIYRVTAARNR